MPSPACKNKNPIEATAELVGTPGRGSLRRLGLRTVYISCPRFELRDADEWVLADTHFPIFFFFNDTATTEIYTLSLHDALPISVGFLGSTGGSLCSTSDAGRP